MTADQYTEETIEAFSQMIPAQRLGTLPDMTDAILFLAGEGAGYINGVVLPVDGGLLASGVSKTGSLRSAASKE
jgi:NAD(P)-dependent dehydrogenase (short-subunit alcohol dehydrogenase family)